MGSHSPCKKLSSELWNLWFWYHTRKLCKFTSILFTWSFSWILLNSSCPPWTCAKEISYVDDSKWNVSSLIYILPSHLQFTLGMTYTFVPSHLLIHFRVNLYFWNVYFRGFVITFSQGRPTIFHIGAFTNSKILHEFFSDLQSFI